MPNAQPRYEALKARFNSGKLNPFLRRHLWCNAQLQDIDDRFETYDVNHPEKLPRLRKITASGDPFNGDNTAFCWLVYDTLKNVWVPYDKRWLKPLTDERRQEIQAMVDNFHTK